MGLFARSPRKRVALADQLEALAGCGIRLNSGIEVEHLLESFTREQYEEEPFRLLLLAMGNTLRREPWPCISDSIWHLDTECIEDSDSYVHIASRIRALSGGELPLTDIQGDIDIDKNKAWLSFRLDGQEIRWEPKVDHDWIDAEILSDFARLMKRRNARKQLTYLGLKGQDCLIGCCTGEEFTQLKKTTGLKFKWLI